MTRDPFPEDRMYEFSHVDPPDTGPADGARYWLLLAALVAFGAVVGAGEWVYHRIRRPWS